MKLSDVIPTPQLEERTYRCYHCRDIGFILRIQEGRHYSSRCETCLEQEKLEIARTPSGKRPRTRPDL